MMPLATTGTRTAEGQRDAGGGGGGGAAYITLPPAPPRSTVVRAPVPHPPKLKSKSKPQSPSVPPEVTPPSTVDTAVSPVSPTATPSTDRVAAPGAGAGSGTGGGSGGGQGEGQGGGVGAGNGPGRGSGSAVGDSGSAKPPEPKQLVLPPSDYPKALRGRTFDVTFLVDARGVVRRVDVSPAIEQHDFAKKFEETMRNYQFRPARSRDGAPVPGSITLKVAFFQ